MPVAVSGIANAVGVLAQRNATSCALLSNGTVRCWGMTTSAEPGAVVSLSSLPKAARFGDSSTCAVMADASVQCWNGSNGLPSAGASVTNAIQAVGAVSFGYALGSDGIVRGWGSAAMPEPVQDLGTAKRITMGQTHYCAISTSDSLLCWGRQGMFDQLIDYGMSPIQVSELSKVTDVSASLWNTCVLEAEHVVKCWGNAVGKPEWSASPVVIAGFFPQN